MTIPIELIKEYFKFLEKYGFSISRKKYSPEIMGNAEVIYQSPSVSVKIVIDRGQVLINIGKVSWLEKDWFEYSDVVSFFAPGEDAYIFPEEADNSQYTLEIQLKRVASMLEKYCRKMLEGDFSMQNQIKEIETKRINKMLSSFHKHSHGDN